MIKDLESEKVRYQTTPRKSLSFSEEREQHKHPTFSYSPLHNDTLERDKTFQIEHLRESGTVDYLNRKSVNRMKQSTESLRESALKESIVHPPLASSKYDKPPITKPPTFLHNNNNKLKMKEKLKKLKVTKSELSTIVKDIEIEKYKATELKNTIFNDIRRSFEEIVKKDEVKLKEDMKKCVEMISEIQSWELNSELKLEKYNSVLDEDILAIEDKLKDFEDLDALRTKVSGIDIKLIEKEKLEEIENELKSSKAELSSIVQEFDKYKNLYNNELHLNQVLSKKIEDVTNRNKRLEQMISDYENDEDEKRMLEHSTRLHNEQLAREKEHLEHQVNELHETARIELKKEIDKQKNRFIDQVVHLNNQIKKFCLNISMDSQIKGIAEDDLQDDEQLIRILKANIEELSKVYEKELDREKTKFREEKKNIEKACNDDYQSYKKTVLNKAELEKEELQKELEKKFKAERENYLAQIEELKSQLAKAAPQEKVDELGESIRIKDQTIQALEEGKSKLEAKLTADIERRGQEIRRENIVSLSLLKEKHEKDLAENAEELKKYYDEVLKDEKKKYEKLEEENNFLAEELDNANKQIFELMRYKVEYADALATERKKIEGEYVDRQTLMSCEFESKVLEWQNINKRNQIDYERRMKEMEINHESETTQLKNSIEAMKENYYQKLEELELIHQSSMQQYVDKIEHFAKFRDEQHKNLKIIEMNLRNTQEELYQKEVLIQEKDAKVDELIEKIRELEYENMRINETHQSKSRNYDRSMKLDEDARARYKKVVNDALVRIRHLGDVLQNYKNTNNLSCKKAVSFDKENISLIHLSKELEQLSRELETENSRDPMQEISGFGNERSLNITENNDPNKMSFNNQNPSKFFNMLNNSYQSQCNRTGHNDSMDFSNEHQDPNKSHRPTQSDYNDESIFPPFDHRVCLRCKQNDLTSPNYCKYANIQNMNELSFHSSKSSMSYKVSKQHVYGVNVRFKSKFGESFIKEFNREPTFEMRDAAINTILSNNDFTAKDRSPFPGEDLLELRTPKRE